MAFNLTPVLSFKRRKPLGRPLLNQIPTNISGRGVLGYSSNVNIKREFWKYFRNRPELNSPVAIRVDDTISEVDFFKPDGSPLGRNKRMEAEKYWSENQCYERLKSVQFDRLVTGDGFIWKGHPDSKSRKEMIEKILFESGKPRFYFKDISKSMIVKAMDEDLRLPRKIDYVASSTVYIEHNEYTPLKYVQRFGGYEEIFDPEEIVHIPLSRIDGKVDGFTPVMSLSYELILLYAIKENMLAYFNNGGSPSKAWILPEELANSENKEWLVQELMNRGMLQNRHGNLVLTGNVKIEDLEPNIKDMDYKELALYVTSNIAYALRVPVSRIPYLIGSAASSSDAGGMAESGYWSMIESDQRTIEMHINPQIFSKLGFIVKFKKRYKIDDLREAQAMNFRTDAVTKIQAELMKTNQMLSETKHRELLDLSSNDVVPLPKELQINQFDKTGLLNRSFAKNEETQDISKQNKDDVKRQASTNNPKNSNQTGS